MRLFKEITKTYKTQENAIKAAEQNFAEELKKHRWIMGVTPEGRFHIIFIGENTLDLIHHGFCVTC